MTNPSGRDGYTQAYNYRYYTTSDPDTRIAITPPPGYDPADYELIGRYVAHLVATIPDQSQLFNRLSRIFPGWMNSAEWNYHRDSLFSMAPVGISHLYADGDYAAKARVWKEHQNYLRGLQTFFSADPRVPEEFRRKTAAIGLELLLDLRMPKMDGLDVVRAIRAKHPDARIVIITTFAGDEDIFRSLKAGAMGYLLKDAPRQQIIEAVRIVSAGEQYIPFVIASKAAEHALKPQITAREIEVLQRMARGESNKEIGVALFISEGTVKTHVKSVLAKLEATNSTFGRCCSKAAHASSPSPASATICMSRCMPSIAAKPSRATV
ncbi:MAG: response regulator transcription factor [Verrucomicrobiota bacterium]|nr:response regulator transcription factor [Verrucomicrobiota bacterium]